LKGDYFKPPTGTECARGLLVHGPPDLCGLLARPPRMSNPYPAGMRIVPSSWDALTIVSTQIDVTKEVSPTSSKPVASVPVGDQNVLIIGPREESQGIFFKIRQLWKSRELIYFLAWRDMKVRYKQTILGAAWAILQPAMMMIVFTIFFSVV